MSYAQQYAAYGATGVMGTVALGSVAVDAATGGLNILATPMELSIAGGLGWALGYEIGSLVDHFSKNTSRRPRACPRPRPYPGNDPAKSPGPGWRWKGSGTPESGQGSWVDPETGQKLHPDLGHGGDVGPHWDWTDPSGEEWRLFPDGTVGPHRR